MDKNEIYISEIFGPTLQGEGPYIGHPTVFVRVFGCNMKPICPWCDSMYAVQKQDDTPKNYPVETIVNTILEHNCKDVTFTGGEPLLYWEQLKKVMDLLSLQDDFKFHFETNGMICIKDILPNNINFVISPKLHAINLETSNRLGNIDVYTGQLRGWLELQENICFKFVYESEETIKQIKNLELLLQGFCSKLVYLMPEGKVFNQEKYLECAKQCLEHGYIMSGRLHTILWGNKRGV